MKAEGGSSAERWNPGHERVWWTSQRCMECTHLCLCMCRVMDDSEACPPPVSFFFFFYPSCLFCKMWILFSCSFAPHAYRRSEKKTPRNLRNVQIVNLTYHTKVFICHHTRTCWCMCVFVSVWSRRCRVSKETDGHVWRLPFLCCVLRHQADFCWFISACHTHVNKNVFSSGHGAFFHLWRNK